MQNIQQQIAALLNNVSTTVANIVYNTVVKTAAAHKNVVITKTVTANVQLFSNIRADDSVFALAVKRSANAIDANNADAVAAFTAQSNYFEHTDCYSIVKHKQNANLYLYAIFNSAKSVYYINNVVATKQQVAQYLTASAAQALLADDAVVHNKTHNVLHTVKVRTIALSNIVSIAANKQTVAF